MLNAADTSQAFEARVKAELGELIFRVIGLQIAVENKDMEIAALTKENTKLQAAKAKP